MKVKNFYSSLLYFYPESYRRNYGKEMEKVFWEMYQDEKTQGRTGVIFWTKIISDVLVSGVGQHLDSLGEKGAKNYLKDTLYLNGFNLLGFIFLLPFMTMVAIDLTTRIVQRDLVHYNRASYTFLSHTFLYDRPILMAWALILPALALLLNLFSLIFGISKKKKSIWSLDFLKMNFFSLIFVGIGLFWLLLIFGHDAIPCTIKGISIKGINNLPQIINYCKNA